MATEQHVGTIEQALLRNRAARVLQAGFRIAVAIMAVGLLLSAITREPLPATLGSPREIAQGIADGDPASLVAAGIIAVILTPFAATATIAWTFHSMGNRRYAAISTLVLLILFVSIGLSVL